MIKKVIKFLKENIKKIPILSNILRPIWRYLTHKDEKEEIARLNNKILILEKELNEIRNNKYVLSMTLSSKEKAIYDYLNGDNHEISD